MKRRHTVAVDLDAVLASYKAGWRGIYNIGEPIPGAVQFTKDISEFANVLIFTTRCCEAANDGHSAEELKQLVVSWLDANGFYYHDVFVGQGKPFYSAVVDDRAVTCRPEDECVGTNKFNTVLQQVLFLCRDAETKDKVKE